MKREEKIFFTMYHPSIRYRRAIVSSERHMSERLLSQCSGSCSTIEGKKAHAHEIQPNLIRVLRCSEPNRLMCVCVHFVLLLCVNVLVPFWHAVSSTEELCSAEDFFYLSLFYLILKMFCFFFGCLCICFEISEEFTDLFNFQMKRLLEIEYIYLF